MSAASRVAILLAMLLGVAMPALSGEGRHGHGDYRDPGLSGGQDRYVDVPGWRLPARRVLPPVGYVAKPFPGEEPVYRGYRSTSPHWIRGLRFDDIRHAPTYVVRDPYRFGLQSPPPGYYWRGDGRGNYLLVAVASGIVVGVVHRGG